MAVPTPPFTHRLPAATAARIRATGAPSAAVDRGTRRHLAAVVLVIGLFGGLSVMGLPATTAHAMPPQECVSNPYWESVNYRSDTAECW
jgi:hypothetical protein